MHNQDVLVMISICKDGCAEGCSLKALVYRIFMKLNKIKLMTAIFVLACASYASFALSSGSIL